MKLMKNHFQSKNILTRVDWVSKEEWDQGKVRMESDEESDFSGLESGLLADVR